MNNYMEELINQIHEQNAWYIAVIGILVTIITIFLAYMGYEQKKISDKQVKKFQTAIKKSQEISQGILENNQSLLQYSLASMANEGYLNPIVEWHQKAQLYLTAKHATETYYSDNGELSRKLIHAKRSTLYSSQRTFEQLIILDEAGTLQTGISKGKYDELAVAYKKSTPTFEVPMQEYIDYDRNQLIKIGHEFKDGKLQQEWFKQLNEFNKFWDEETL